MPLLSGERSDANVLAPMPYRDDFTVGSNGDGGLNTYYPVRVTKTDYESENRFDQYQIFRTYARTGPSEHGTHKAGLSCAWHGTAGGTATGSKVLYCHEFRTTYRRTLGGAEIWNAPGVDSVFFYLRGGGYAYTLRCSAPFSVTIYLSETLVYNGPGGSWYAVPRTEATISANGTVIGTGGSLGTVYGATTLSGTFERNP